MRYSLHGAVSGKNTTVIIQLNGKIALHSLSLSLFLVARFGVELKH